MTELLTVKQVQDLLKVDRITVYRMLKDGRLTGVKIGHQWRFPNADIEALLSTSVSRNIETIPISTNGHSADQSRYPAPFAPQSQGPLPVHCVQLIQDVFAQVAEVGSVTTSPDGQPLTEMSNSCRFCQLIMSSPLGCAECQKSWLRTPRQSGDKLRFATCHAGLQYAGSAINLAGEPVAVIVAGQFYTAEPDPVEEAARLQKLADNYDLDADELAGAAAELQVLNERKRSSIGGWLDSVAHTFEDITQERAQLMGRLRTIAAMSTLES